MPGSACGFSRYLLVRKSYTLLLAFLVCRAFAGLLVRQADAEAAPSIYTLF